MDNLNVVILSAGMGFRLYPFTLHRPKALCTVANVSLLKRLLSQLQAAGFVRSAIALPPTAVAVQDLAMAAAPPGFELETVFAKTSADAKVSLVRRAIGASLSPVLVIYGDSLLSVDFRELVARHERNRAKGCLATILYHRPSDLRVPEKSGRTYHGVMSVKEDGRVTRFVEKPKVEEISPGFDLANAAVFVMHRELLDRPELQEARDFSFDVFERATEQGWPLFACDIGRGFRFDVGGIARWYELNLKVIRKEIGAPVPGREISPRIWVGDETDRVSASLEAPVLLGDKVRVGAGARLGPEIVVGNCCRIGEGAAVRRSVIMEDCSIGVGSEIDHCLIGAHCNIADGIILAPFTVLGAYTVVGNDAWPNWAEDKEFQYV
jgi:mannose-1-phosphate guanylyltransferase/phosphomannomutase